MVENAQLLHHYLAEPFFIPKEFLNVYRTHNQGCADGGVGAWGRLAPNAHVKAKKFVIKQIL